jgi:galactose-1-phosphate uridylyltransferase
MVKKVLILSWYLVIDKYHNKEYKTLEDVPLKEILKEYDVLIRELDEDSKYSYTIYLDEKGSYFN